MAQLPFPSFQQPHKISEREASPVKRQKIGDSFNPFQQPRRSLALNRNDLLRTSLYTQPAQHKNQNLDIGFDSNQQEKARNQSFQLQNDNFSFTSNRKQTHTPSQIFETRSNVNRTIDSGFQTIRAQPPGDSRIRLNTISNFHLSGGTENQNSQITKSAREQPRRNTIFDISRSERGSVVSQKDRAPLSRNFDQKFEVFKMDKPPIDDRPKPFNSTVYSSPSSPQQNLNLLAPPPMSFTPQTAKGNSFTNQSIK